MKIGHTPDWSGVGEDGARELWYGLGRVYSRAGGQGSRSSAVGFTVAFLAGALVLLSVPLFGTGWARSFPVALAAALPVVAGVLAGGVPFAWRRLRTWKEAKALRRALAENGRDASRPTAEGLHLYYDAQLILLRSEYEFLRLRGAQKSARLFELSFGFTPEDPFETGPLNVAPDTRRMHLLRERWERRLSVLREGGTGAPGLGLREDMAYSVFPREMTVPAELATRGAYLTISCDLLSRRYGRDPRKKLQLMPEEVRRRAERDLREYAVLTERRRR